MRRLTGSGSRSVSRDVVDTDDVATRLDGGGGMAVTFDRESGSEALEQRVLRFPAGSSTPQTPDEREQAFFVLAGRGALTVAEDAIDLEPGTAVRVGPAQSYGVESEEELLLLCVLVPPAEGIASPSGATAVRLAEREAEEATSDREFRVLLEPSSGLTGATQFVGYIPAKRAPEHYHTYDEVIYVLDGEGVLHLGAERTPIHPGSCIHLSPKQVHCLENTGSGVMRVLGVFRPAGSPAEAYLPDGTPAYYPQEGER